MVTPGSRSRLVVGLWVGVAAVLGWGVIDFFSVPEPAAPAAVSVAAAPAKGPIPAATPVAAAKPLALAAAAAPLPDCPHQQLEISTPAGVERGCVTVTRTQQTGSTRRYLLEAEGVSRWSLSLDTAGGRVIAARLVASGRGGFGCKAEQCQGFAISRPDRNGVRTISLAGVLLEGRIDVAAPVGPDGRSVVPAVRLSASLKTRPDSQSLALACRVPSVTIVESDAALTQFCPMGGAGFELGDDGRYRYEFRNLEGETLAVVLAADGTVSQLSFGALACSGAACSGTASRSLDPPGGEAHERDFEFSGVRLQDPEHPQNAAQLTGRLLLPAQN